MSLSVGVEFGYGGWLSVYVQHLLPVLVEADWDMTASAEYVHLESFRKHLV